MSYSIGDFVVGFEEYGGKIRFFKVVGEDDQNLTLCEIGSKVINQLGYLFYQMDMKNLIQMISLPKEPCELAGLRWIGKITDKLKLYEAFNAKIGGRLVDLRIGKSLDEMMI